MYGHVIRRNRWKLILDDRLSTVRLYDLQADPGERIDLSRVRPRIVRELTQDVLDWARELPPALFLPDVVVSVKAVEPGLVAAVSARKA